MHVKVTKSNWFKGVIEENTIQLHLFTIEAFASIGDNKPLLQCQVSDFGGTIASLHCEDKNGNLGDIVLGFQDPHDYLTNGPYFGSSIGRYANRIANGTFELEGETYNLCRNNGSNCLHGGQRGFNKRVFSVSVIGNGVSMEYTSPNGEEGFPGTLKVSITYQIELCNEKPSLFIHYKANCIDRPTIVNLSNHSYFNLSNDHSKGILDHILYINADAYTPTNEFSIPIGSIDPIENSPLDFRVPKCIGKDIPSNGYDHNFVLSLSKGPNAVLSCPSSGRQLEIYSTQPGLQLYTSNFLDSSWTGKQGVSCFPHQAVCLETQYFPDSVHHPQFPSTVLYPGATYSETAQFVFSTIN